MLSAPVEETLLEKGVSWKNESLCALLPGLSVYGGSECGALVISRTLCTSDTSAIKQVPMGVARGFTTTEDRTLV